jgi:broad specificity phosphatase PhoE
MTERLFVELFADMDAGDRRLWTADQDTRPLSELGRQQARYLCDELAREPINAVYSSGALRCLQSIEPLADRYGLSITVLPGLHETGWLPPPHWRNESFPATDGPLGGAFAAGVGMQALRTIRANHRGGRVAACTHGDILPAIVLFLNGAYELGVPAPPTRRAAAGTR